MQKTTTLVFLLFASLLPFSGGFAQQNCSNPVLVELCSGGTLLNQTNAGMLNDYPSSCNITGEDMVYKLHSPGSNTRRIFIAVRNATGSMKVSLQTACGSGSCQSQTISSGNTNITFTVSPLAYYYAWIDASGTRTFDISFGADTGSTMLNIPNTQGNWGYDSVCATHPFFPTKPIFEMMYNDTFRQNPVTFSPLNQIGTICFTTFLKNTTGAEGVKTFDFIFNSVGYSAITPVQAVLPGNYNAGTWQATQLSSYKWQYKFLDSLASGRGDFTGSPNTCLTYKFCFNIKPLSNNPDFTNIQVIATSDGFGVGFSGIIALGCCPAPYQNCLGATGGNASAAAHTLGFSMDDPGGLPVQLLFFRAEPGDKEIKLLWSTATETNNDYFTLQRSTDAVNWQYVDRIEGHGNSALPIEYSYTDQKPLTGTSYYRLLQTDYDGTRTVAGLCAARLERKEIKIYPNPARADLYIEHEEEEKLTIQLVNSLGTIVPVRIERQENRTHVDLSMLAEGLYYLYVSSDGQDLKKQCVAVTGKGF